MRVLVVEDQLIIAFFLVDELLKAGHEPIGPAATSQDALRLAASEAPEIALVDLDLERKAAGLEVAHQLTMQKNITVIFCTGEPEVARRARSGAIGLFRKPYDPRDVVACVEAIERMRGDGSTAPKFPRSFELLTDASS